MQTAPLQAAVASGRDGAGEGMTRTEAAPAWQPSALESSDFSLVLGGPLYQLLRRAHLSDDVLMLARQRVVVISLLAWLPLLVLPLIEGRATGGSVAVPFLRDFEVHIRYLVALPLLIAAELVVHRRMRSLVRVFLERRLIPQSALSRFDAALASAYRLRNSMRAEVLLIVVVYLVGILIVWRHYLALDALTWYATPAPGGSTLTLAGCANGFDIVRTMRQVPLTKEMIIRIAAATLAPVVPLALTMMPLDELLKMLLGVLL